MKITAFDFNLAQQLYTSVEEFPVNFDDAWRWLGYARKGIAKKVLVKNFIENVDYRLHNLVKSAPAGGLTHREDIFLSSNCLKEMGMIAGTAKGKEVRHYFLECERIAKATISSQPPRGLADTIADIQAIFNCLDGLDRISPDIKTQHFLKAVAKARPDYAGAIEEATTVVSAAYSRPTQDLIPGEIADQVSKTLGRKIKAQDINHALEELGLQYKLNTKQDKKWKWDLTEKGREYGKVYSVTGSGNNWSGGQIKWNPSVIELLLELLAMSAQL